MGKSFELDGTIKVINEIQTFQSGFSKREFVVEVEDGKYPQMVKFECVKDKTAMTDGFSIGDQVNVSFDIRGNEYNGRYYVNLNAWKMQRAGGGGGAAPAADLPPEGMITSEAPPFSTNEQEDDIPF